MVVIKLPHYNKRRPFQRVETISAFLASGIAKAEIDYSDAYCNLYSARVGLLQCILRMGLEDVLAVRQEQKRLILYRRPEKWMEAHE